MLSLRDFMDKGRLESLAKKLSFAFKKPSSEMLKTMDADFFASFMSGFYGNVMMFQAGEIYVRELERETEEFVT